MNFYIIQNTKMGSSKSKWNTNVKLALAFSFLGSASRGIWAFTTLSVYLKLLSGTIGMVGVAEGAQGVSQCLAAVVGGTIADYFRRDTVLHVSGLIGLASCGFITYLLLEEISDDLRFWLMTGALAAMGSFQGISATCIDTLFADSVKTGQRTRFNTLRFILTQLSSVSGPAICVVLFSTYGNDWAYSRITTVFTIGIVINVFPILLLFFMSDDHSLGDDSESHHLPSTPGGLAYQRLVDEVINAQEISVQSARITYRVHNEYSPDRRIRRSHSVSNLPHHQQELEGDFRDIENRPTNPENWIRQEHIPTLVLVSDFISGLGSGMSVKFFPLFFKQHLELDPISINCIYIVLPIFMTIVAIGSQKLAKSFGRAHVSSMLNYAGCLGLFGLAAVGKYLDSNDWRIVLPIYFISTLQHCTRPLKKAILMDYVPKSKRARYNSIDSINRFGWSGSAVFGGFSVDKYGFGPLFFMTACILFLSSFIFSFLTAVVPREELGNNRLIENDDESSDDEEQLGATNLPTTPFIS